MSYSIFLCGVGGQGLVLLTSVLGNACAKSDLEAKTGEMYGLSQRSGSVFVHMRIEAEAYSPLIPIGGADLMIGLEAIETLRYIEFLKKDGIILLNSRIMHPPIETSKLVTNKNEKYITLNEILAKLHIWTPNVATINALELAKQSGTSNAENTVFLGALSAIKAFPVNEDQILESLKEIVPKKYIENNLMAFRLGKEKAYGELCSRLECKLPGK